MSAQQIALRASQIRAQLLTQGYGKTLHEWSTVLLPQLEPKDQKKLYHAVELGYTYAEARPLRPGVFAEYLRNVRLEDASNSQVRVMTIHQSKGLEFDIVLLPDLDSSLIDHHLLS